MISTIESAACRYQGIVFKQAPPTADFACSSEVLLPGRHTERGAWAAVFAELRGPRAAELVGGDVRPFCGN